MVDYFRIAKVSCFYQNKIHDHSYKKGDKDNPGVCTTEKKRKYKDV